MAAPAATWSGQAIITAVSRFTGLANDTNSRPAVLDYVNLALWDISLQTPWKWNQVIMTPDITVTAGVADYPLPTGAGLVFDDVYDVRLLGGPGVERTIQPIDLRTYDRSRAGVQTGQSSPSHYFIYAPEQNSLITLVPTPNVGNVLRIRYVTRQAIISDATASSLSVPDKFMPLVIYKGAEMCSSWKAPERVAYWHGMYGEALRRALQIDRETPDETPVMVPRNQQGMGYDPLYPDDLHEYSR